MWRAAASSQTRPSIGSVVPPSAARAFTTPKQNASYERRLNCWVIELLPCHIFVTSIRFVTPIQLSTGNGSIGLAVVIAVVGVGLHRPFHHMAASSFSTGTSSVSK